MEHYIHSMITLQKYLTRQKKIKVMRITKMNKMNNTILNIHGIITVTNIGQMINLLKSITTTIKKFIYKDGIKTITYIETMITLLLYIIIQIMLLNI